MAAPILDAVRLRAILEPVCRDEAIDPEPCPDRAASFFDSLDRDETPINDGQAALATTRICCAFNESVRTRQVVHLS